MRHRRCHRTGPDDRALILGQYREQLVQIRDFVCRTSITPRLCIRDMPSLFENLGVALRFSLRLQEGRIRDLQQPANE